MRCSQVAIYQYPCRFDMHGGQLLPRSNCGRILPVSSLGIYDSSSSGSSDSEKQSSHRNWPSWGLSSSAQDPQWSQYPESGALSLARLSTGAIWDFSAMTSINAGVMSTMSLLVMMPFNLE